MKKFLAITLALLLVVGSLTACNMTETDDSNVVIAKVNGVEILKKDYNESYNYWYYYLVNSYGYTADQAKEYLEEQKSQLLDQLVQDEVVRQEAEKEGYLNYTDEDHATAKTKIDSDRQSYIDNLVTSYTSALSGQTITGKKDGETDDAYFKRIAEEDYYKNLKTNGYTEEDMIQEEMKTEALDKFKTEKLKDVTVTDSTVLTAYDDAYSEQSEAITSADSFVSAWNNKTYDTFVYYYAGFSLVQQILVAFDSDTSTQLQTYYTSISDAKTQISTDEESLKDEKDADTIKTLNDDITTAKATLDTAQKNYDALLVTAKAAIQSKTDDIYNQVKGGDEANFIKVMIDNTDDTGMKDEDTAKKGYLVGPSDGMVTEFSTAAQALQNAGDISQPITTYFGYHIIRKIKSLPSGKAAFDDVKDALKTTATETEKDTQWTSMTDTWTKASKVKKYESRITS